MQPGIEMVDLGPGVGSVIGGVEEGYWADAAGTSPQGGGKFDNIFCDGVDGSPSGDNDTI